MKYYKSVFLGVTLIFLISLFFASKGDCIFNEKIIDYIIGDINGDTKDEMVLLTKGIFGKYGKEVVVYSSNDKEMYREDFSKLKPWKVVLGDIDGDGIKEVSIGVYKKTIFHKIMDKRPFIYSYIDGRLQPKWKGSRLSRPFTDYTFYDIDGDGIDEIIAIEILESGEKVINTYKWRGFGFEGFIESERHKDLTKLLVCEDSISIYVKQSNGNRLLGNIILRDNELVIERVRDK